MNQYTASRQTVLFALLLTEGGIVLAHQIVAPKILEPIFGNSILVWSMVLVCSLGGLSIGYALGDLISQKLNARQWLVRTMLASACTLCALPALRGTMLFVSDFLPLTPGILFGTFLVVAPLMALLGTCCPLAVTILCQHGWKPASATGAVFSTSTLGGILGSTIVAIWALPLIGITLTCFVTAALLLSVTILFHFVCADR